MPLLLLDKTVDFFNNTLNLKIKKGQLIAALIIVELTGILVLGWYLRGPLYQKYLTVSTRTYSLSALQTNQKYIFTQGDFIVGSTNPTNQVVVLLRQEADLSKKSKLKVPVSSTGAWDFRLPTDLEPGSYRLTVGVFKDNNESVSINTYKIRALSSAVFSNDRAFKEFLALFTKPSSTTPTPAIFTNPEDIQEINLSVGNTDVPIEQKGSSDQIPQAPAKPLLDN